MHAGVNCDHVFDVLTSGPFPRGRSDDLFVELHLGCCHQCRRLAESLRPAVDLMRESLDDADDSLPGYRGMLCEESSPEDPSAECPDFVRRVMSQIERESTDRRPVGRRVEWRTAIGVAAAALVLCLASAVHFRAGAVDGTSRRGADGLAAIISESPVRLAALDLPSSCLLPADQVAADESRYRCCTQCHSASSPDRPRVDVASMLDLQACLACHK